MAELISQAVRKFDVSPLLHRIGKLAERRSHRGDGLGAEPPQRVEERTEGDLPKGETHGGKSSTDLVPVHSPELLQSIGKIIQALNSGPDCSGTEQTTDVGQHAKAAGNTADFEQGATHGDEALADLVPTELRELAESFSKVRKCFGGESDGGCTKHARQASKLADTNGNEANLTHGSTHGDETSADLTPIEFGELAESFAEFSQRFDGQLEVRATKESGNLAEFAQSDGNKTDFTKCATHGDEALADLIPIVVGEFAESIAQFGEGFDGDVDGRSAEQSGKFTELSDTDGDQTDFTKGATHGDKALADGLPIVECEFAEGIRQGWERIGYYFDADGSNDGLQSGDLTNASRNDGHFAESPAHCGKPSSDGAPIVLGEFIECVGDVAERLRHEHDACRCFDLALSESTKQHHDAGHFGKCPTHCGKASSDLIPIGLGDLHEGVGDITE